MAFISLHPSVRWSICQVTHLSGDPSVRWPICQVTHLSVHDNLLNVVVSCYHCRGHHRWDLVPEWSCLPHGVYQSFKCEPKLICFSSVMWLWSVQSEFSLLSVRWRWALSFRQITELCVCACVCVCVCVCVWCQSGRVHRGGEQTSSGAPDQGGRDHPPIWPDRVAGFRPFPGLITFTFYCSRDNNVCSHDNNQARPSVFWDLMMSQF